MNNSRKILAGMIVAAGLATTAAVADARPGMGPGPGACAYGGTGPGMMGYGPGGGRGPGIAGGRWSNPAAAVEGRLAALKIELKITSNQESAWQAFTTKARQQAESRQARRAQMIAQRSDTSQPAPERLAQRTELAKQRIANMESMTAAVKDLYAALTPEQKALADQQFARRPMGSFGGRGFGRSGFGR